MELSLLTAETSCNIELRKMKHKATKRVDTRIQQLSESAPQHGMQRVRAAAGRWLQLLWLYCTVSRLELLLSPDWKRLDCSEAYCCTEPRPLLFTLTKVPVYG